MGFTNFFDDFGERWQADQENNSQFSAGSGDASAELQTALDAIGEFKEAVAQINVAVSRIKGQGDQAVQHIRREKEDALVGIAGMLLKAVTSLGNLKRNTQADIEQARREAIEGGEKVEGIKPLWGKAVLGILTAWGNAVKLLDERQAELEALILKERQALLTARQAPPPPPAPTLETQMGQALRRSGSSIRQR